jgi:hypothetical protein
MCSVSTPVSGAWMFSRRSALSEATDRRGLAERERSIIDAEDSSDIVCIDIVWIGGYR